MASAIDRLRPTNRLFSVLAQCVEVDPLLWTLSLSWTEHVSTFRAVMTTPRSPRRTELPFLRVEISFENFLREEGLVQVLPPQCRLLGRRWAIFVRISRYLYPCALSDALYAVTCSTLTYRFCWLNDVVRRLTQSGGKASLKLGDPSFLFTVLREYW